MNTLVSRTLLAAAAIGALALPAPAAHAETVSRGGCGLWAATDPTGHRADPDTFTGRLYAYYALADSATGAPATATVTCTLRVRGAVAAAGTFTGTGVVTGSVPVEFASDDPLDTEVCEDVDFADPGTPDRGVCYVHTLEQVPPQELYDLLDAVLAPVPGWKGTVCDAVRTVEPFVPDVWGGLVVTNEGDVYAGDHGHYWYCP